MSNLNQFFSAGFPIGSILAMPFAGDIYTAPDGSEWYSNVATAPFEYDSDYSYLPDHFTACHPFMPGPESDGTWFPPTTNFSIAYNDSDGIYCTSQYRGTTGTDFDYYTSSDGSTWTKRTLPNSTLTYNIAAFTAGKFIMAANSATTNGIITSTDAITWNSVTGVSLTPQEILSDGNQNIIVLGTSTPTARSGDGGATFSSVSLPATPTNGTLPGRGVGTWNAGAGLFIVLSTSAGRYYTSTDGSSWTDRTNIATYSKYSQFVGTSFIASNATTTVVVGSGLFFATTTDGLTWANHGFISSNYSSPTIPNQMYYDGTRFVVRVGQRVFYSTNGTTWTEGKQIGGHTLIIPQSNGVLFAFPLLTNHIRTKMLRISDITSTTRQVVISPILHVAQSTGNMTHYRLR